ncbi:MAG: nucleoside deaminase [Rhodospirillales bacterium]|nr:nucleoside deaminase [Rhodospirillales bacterium]MDE0381065.1 nucleoside deaminase [Rhodospirillales bacterium]
MDHEGNMRRAIALCEEKMAAGEGGYCATIIVRDGAVIGEGWNNVAENCDATGHCEINAIRDAGRRTGNWDLSGSTLYTTWEPCIMCAAAIWWARIDRVFYGNLLSHAADLGIDVAGLETEAATPTEQRGRPYRRLLGDETYAMFKAWWESADRATI